MDVASGNIEVTTEKNGKRKSEHHHLKIPEDVADGLLTTLVKNISPSDPEITVSLVSESSSPRVVKLKIHAEGEHAFSASGRIVEGTHFVIHTDIGGVAGVVAPVIGKQPVDLHFWIMEGKAPAFLKFTGQLFDGGPVWNIEKAVIRWENAR